MAFPKIDADDAALTRERNEHDWLPDYDSEDQDDAAATINDITPLVAHQLSMEKNLKPGPVGESVDFTFETSQPQPSSNRQSNSLSCFQSYRQASHYASRKSKRQLRAEQRQQNKDMAEAEHALQTLSLGSQPESTTSVAENLTDAAREMIQKQTMHHSLDTQNKTKYQRKKERKIALVTQKVLAKRGVLGAERKAHAIKGMIPQDLIRNVKHGDMECSKEVQEEAAEILGEVAAGLRNVKRSRMVADRTGKRRQRHERTWFTRDTEAASRQ